MGEMIPLVLILGFLSGIIGVLIANWKNRSPGAGFLLGFFLGPIGWLIMAVQADGPKPNAKLAGENDLSKSLREAEKRK